jgi:hypothetical protein
MISAELCRRKAAECRAVAEHIADPKHKSAMLHYARWWMRLAEYVDKTGDGAVIAQPTADNPFRDALCPACGLQMQLNRIMPREDFTVAQQVLQCTGCGVIVSKAA